MGGEIRGRKSSSPQKGDKERVQRQQGFWVGGVIHTRVSLLPPEATADIDIRDGDDNDDK